MYKIVMSLMVVLVATIECGSKRVEEVDCNLMGDADSSSSIICKLNEPNAQIVASRPGSLLPLKVDGQNLIWVNKYQPASSRWSDLCPSKYLLTGYQYRPSVCLNENTCDQTGRCKLGLNVTDPSREVYVNLVDDLNKQSEIPKFTPDLKFINVSIDLSTSENPTEYTLVDATDKLDPYRSKPNRALNQFRLESLNDELTQYGADTLPVPSQCKTTAAVPFGLRYDNELERLYLTVPNDLRKLTECYVLNLIVKRRSFDDQIDLQSSLALVYIILNDNRVDRPMFDQSVYNFTIDENMPLNQAIGSVRAVYQPTIVDVEESVNYRIVPFVSDVGSSGGDQLPVRIDPTTGSIVVKSYIDREKFADNLIRFNVESSFAGTSYSYAMVNLLIRDLNDNAPVPRIRPVGSFAKSFSNEQQQQQQQPSLYVNEDTSVNQILAYVGVYDPDAGENGTIKSVELTLINLKKPTQRTIAQRQAKLDQLKRSNVSQTVWRRMFDELTQLSSSSSPAIPFRLNKIGDKLFTIQLTRKLNFNLAESYSVEMKIQDNGTRPQLESKTRINLNVIGNNRHAPVFLNTATDEIQLIEGSLSNDSWPRVIYTFSAVDLDDDKNGLVRYKFANNPLLSQLKSADNVKATTLLESTFELDRDSGELRQLAPLDREDFTSDTIEFVVTAQDQAEPITERLTTSTKLRVKILDVNDNKPVFGGAILSSSQLNIRAAIRAESEERFVKIASSIDLTDADAYETNSANYLNVNLNRAKESLFENPPQLGEHFKFDHLTCYKTFNLELVEQNSSTVPVVVLVENDDDLLINYVHCKLSLWLDVALLRQMKGNLTGTQVFDFSLRVTDYGLNGGDVEPSTLDLHIELNLNSAAVASDTIDVDLDAKQPARLNLKDHFWSLGSVSRLEEKSTGHVDITRKFKVNRDLNTLDWDQESAEPGVYLIDMFYGDQDQLTLDQIVLIAYDQQRPKKHQQHQMVTYKQHITRLLESTEPKFKLNLDRLSQFQSLLLGTGDRFLIGQFQNSTSMFSLLVNNRSTFLKFISVTLVVSFVVLALFIFCILLIIRRNFSSAKKKKMSDDQLQAQSNIERKKDLNVIDDTETNNGKFARLIVGEEKCVSDGQNTSVEKVNRYLDTLPDETFQQQSSSPASSSSMVDSNKNLIIPVDYYQNNKQPSKRPAAVTANHDGKQTSVCTLSTTSSSCISDEGCYGSSDFSSEKDSKRQLKSAAQQQQQQQFVVYNNGRTQTPTLKYHQQQQQQNYYINNLSRFEKIYNNDSSNRIYCENYVRTNTTAVVTSSSSPTSDLVVDLNVKSNDHRLSPYLVKPSSSSSASSSSSSTNSSILSNANNVQVVTSISGSYV